MASNKCQSIEAITKRLGLRGVLRGCRKEWKTEGTEALKLDISELNKKFYRLALNAMTTDKSLQKAVLQLLASHGPTLWPVPQPGKRGDRKWLYEAQSMDAPEYELDLIYKHHHDRIKPEFVNLILAKLRRYKTDRNKNGVLRNYSTAKRVTGCDFKRKVKRHKRASSTTPELTELTTDDEDDADSLMNELSELNARCIRDDARDSSGSERDESNDQSQTQLCRPVYKRRRISEGTKENMVSKKVALKVPPEKLQALQTNGVVHPYSAGLPKINLETIYPRSTQTVAPSSSLAKHPPNIGDDLRAGQMISSVETVTQGLPSPYQDRLAFPSLPNIESTPSGILSRDRYPVDEIDLTPYPGSTVLESLRSAYQSNDFDRLAKKEDDLMITESPRDWKVSSARRTSSRSHYPTTSPSVSRNQRDSSAMEKHVPSSLYHVPGSKFRTQDLHQDSHETRDAHLTPLEKRLAKMSLELRRRDGCSRTLTPAAFKNCSTAQQARHALKKYIVQCVGDDGLKDTETLFGYLHEVTSGEKVEKFKYRLPLHEDFELAWDMVSQDLIGLEIRDTVKFQLCITLLRADED